MARLDDEFVGLLECPISHRPLVQVGEWLYSTDVDSPRRFPICDGIPNLLPEAAETVSPEEFGRIMAEVGRAGAAE